MSTNKKMIKFYLIFSIVTLIFTYLCDLNSEIHFISLNSIWISNSFCLMIVSGIFTGLVFAFAVELRQYHINKLTAKDNLYSMLLDFYRELSLQRGSIEYFIDNPNYAVPPSFLDEKISNKLKCILASIERVEYDTIFSKDRIRIAFEKYKSNISSIVNIINNMSFVQISINRERLKNINVKDVTYSDLEVSIVLDRLKTDFSYVLLLTSEFAESFQKMNSKRYCWHKCKDIIDNNRKSTENLYDLYIKSDKSSN